MSYPCMSCTGYCCARFENLYIALADVYRLSSGLGVTPRTFTALEEYEDGPIEIDGKSYETALKQRRLRFGSEPEGCGFVISLPNGLYRCGVYGLRPMMCRVYPMEEAVGGVVSVRRDNICPQKGAGWNDGRIEHGEFYQWMRESDVDIEGHQIIVDAWNGLGMEFKSLAAARNSLLALAMNIYRPIGNWNGQNRRAYIASIQDGVDAFLERNRAAGITPGDDEEKDDA